ncbi:MAG: adenosylcobalamin-dependent ribonucleoside-diphosphate reductase [Chloroflexi bacterium]|nr:adenosylcobalamin-dependent ribonucleoside-diphosphate reductase [Chloroflexota bacterium]
MTDNARTVLKRRYLRRGPNGQPVETEEEMFWRVAWNVAMPEVNYDSDQQAVAETFYHMLTAREFFPNSPTFTGAGTPLGQLAACFVLKIDDDMGRTGQGIFDTLRHAALIQQTGGGNGFAFSGLRPKGAIVRSSNGQATGPVGFLRVYDQAFGEIAQGGSRRGANMGVLRVDHPDIYEFITCKTSEDAITNFNISVGITDEFMQAVRDDTDFTLRSPENREPWKTVRARDLFNEIVTHAHHNGEPGMLFLDTANRDNPVPHLYDLEATNPCGEQWLGPFENCCLGSINLAVHVTDDGRVDWDKLKETTRLATRFLDDVVDANSYVPEIPQLRAAAERVRRIGLGIMGLADMMYMLGVRYGSPEGQEFASQVMEFIQYHAMKTSTRLAKERGSFLAITGSRFDPDDLQWEPPTPLVPYTGDWGRPTIDWAKVTKAIKKHGIRNGAVTTIAPTGTISTVAGVEGYGCEPVFALAYVRYFDDNGVRRQLQYTSPLFEKALIDAGVDEATRQRIIERANATGTLQGIEEVPDAIRRVFVVASDITAEEHVRMQAVLQRFVSNAISKTCNFPETATEQDVADAFLRAWELGCKGLTVYVAGSREKVVLETQSTRSKREGEPEAESEPARKEESVQQPRLWPEEPKKPRAQVLNGFTYRVETPVGTAFVTINENGGNQPFEVFINTSKAGSETAAVSEAMGRLISYVLRIRSDVPPRERMQEIARQLEGIGGMRPLGFGENRVRSLPDGVSQMLRDYLDNADHIAERTASTGRRDVGDETLDSPADQRARGQLMMQIGDLCPECGEAAVVNEEGCRKCYACGYSEC